MVNCFRLEGSSMLPVFRPGMTAIVECKTRNVKYEIKSGDCAVYSCGGRILLHRVLQTGPAGAWFADDAGRIDPHLVLWENIRGKVLSGHPLAGGFCGLVYSKLRRAVSKAFINA
jgi:hypothetical protein